MHLLTRMCTILLVVLAALITAAPGVGRAATSPTIVLVHGAFADATSWSGVATKLRAQGYRVVTPDNALRGPSFDARRLEKVLAGINGPVVLVGHSYGGAVITEANNPNVRALVYIAAFGVDAGEPVMAMLNPLRFPGSQLIPPTLQFSLVDDKYGTGVAGKSLDGIVAPDRFHSVFAQDVDDRTAAVMLAHQKSAAAAGNLEPITTPSWRSTPSWYLVSANDRVIPPAAQRFMAARMGARTATVAASHASLVSQPAVVAAMIGAAAKSVR